MVIMPRRIISAGGLDRAIGSGSIQQLKYMLNGMTNLSGLQTLNGLSPLVLALHIPDDIPRRNVFNYLLYRGADVSCKDPMTGRDVLAWACHLGHAEQIQKLLQLAPGEFNLREGDKEGVCPIHHACNSGNPFAAFHIVKEMRKYGVSVDLINPKDGLTPLLAAKRLGYELISQLLISEGKANPTQFDTKMFRTKTRWSQIGCEERDEREMNQLFSDIQITGSARPHTSYQKRREANHQLRRPQTTRSTRSKPDQNPRPVTSSTDNRLLQDRQSPSKEMHRDLHIIDIKDAVDGKVKYFHINSHKTLTNDKDSTDSSKPNLSSGSTPSSESTSDRQMAWTKLNSLMSLSENASVFSFSPDQFARSVSVSATTQNSSQHQLNKGQSGGESDGNVMISSMMTALADQMSPAFRKTAKPRPKPKTPPPQPKPRKKKGSTLAFIMQTMGGKPSKHYRLRNGAVSRNAVTFGGNNINSAFSEQTTIRRSYTNARFTKPKKTQDNHKKLPAIKMS